MCGRFTLRTSGTALATLFDLPEAPALAPRYNIAPTQPVAIVRMNSHTKQREWTHVLWGLIPSWSKDPSMGARMINARSETVAEKPSFCAAYKRRRCLVPTDGFYEWKKVGKAKQPYHITVNEPETEDLLGTSSKRDEAGELPFAIAGLWEQWSSADGSMLESCTLITTEPNDATKVIHNRMPVILAPSDYALWLGSGTDEQREYYRDLPHLMRPCPAEWISMRAVSTFVNNSRNEGEGCLEAV